MAEVLLDQRTSQNWHRVVSIDPFTAVHQKFKLLDGTWFMYYERKYANSEVAHQDAERDALDEIMAEVYL